MKIIHEYRKKPKKAIETYAGKELKPTDYEKKKVTTEDYATLLLNFDSGARAYTFYPGGHPEAYPDGLKNFLLNVYTFIKDGKDPLKDKPNFSTFADGQGELLICDAVLESSKTGKWIEVKR